MRLEYFQMIDRVEALDAEARTLRAACAVPEESPIFEGHFPGYPIMPGVLLIETMAQAGGWLVMGVLHRFAQMAFLVQAREAKLRSFVSPGAALTAEARILHDGSGYAVIAGAIREGSKRVAEAEITYRILPFPNETLRARMLDTARRVGMPAEWLEQGAS